MQSDQSFCKSMTKATDRTSFGVFKLKKRLHRKNVTLLEIHVTAQMLRMILTQLAYIVNAKKL